MTAVMAWAEAGDAAKLEGLLLAGASPNRTRAGDPASALTIAIANYGWVNVDASPAPKSTSSHTHASRALGTNPDIRAVRRTNSPNGVARARPG